MNSQLLMLFGTIVLGIVGLRFLLPKIVHWMGLHPSYEGETYRLPGKRALIIATNHGVLNAPGKTDGPPTGVAASEMTHPYYGFMDAGMEVDVASIKGGLVPVDPKTLNFVIRSPEDKRYLEDPVLQGKAKNSLRIDDVDFTEYDAIFVSGGWGAAYDLGFSDVLGKKMSEAYYADTPVFGSVCHGALGFIRAKDRDGKPLIAGRRMTGVTDKQVHELGIDVTPQHPETELRRVGVFYESATAFRDLFATHVSVDDERRFVTGQNQNSGHETAHAMMALIAEESRR
ncbi:MAG: type 1 glutamine amidotransferase domain-containing protein [Myxococcota bacterium]